MTTKPKKLYKFLRTGLKSQNGGHEWKIGEWYKEDKVNICNQGFHASKTPLQALGYVPGEIVALVEVRGQSIIEDDKECWSEMRIVKAWNWEKKDSVALSIFAAEQVLKNYEKKYPNDKRPREAIEAVKKVLADDTEENRSAARSAAAWSERSAARSAASKELGNWREKIADFFIEEVCKLAEEMKRQTGEISEITELENGDYLQGEFNGWNAALESFISKIKEK